MNITSFQGRWAFICGAAVGVLIAFPLAAPLFGGKILEPVATLWGNALGAIGAVAAAIWASDRASNLQRRQGASLILTFVLPIEQSLAELTYVYGRSAPVNDDTSQEPHLLDRTTADQVQKLCFATRTAYCKFKQAASRVEAVLTFLGPHEMQNFFALEVELENMEQVVGNLVHHAATSVNQTHGHTPSTGLRTRLLQTDGKIKRYMRLLEGAAR